MQCQRFGIVSVETWKRAWWCGGNGNYHSGEKATRWRGSNRYWQQRSDAVPIGIGNARTGRSNRMITKWSRRHALYMVTWSTVRWVSIIWAMSSAKATWLHGNVVTFASTWFHGNGVTIAATWQHGIKALVAWIRFWAQLFYHPSASWNHCVVPNDNGSNGEWAAAYQW